MSPRGGARTGSGPKPKDPSGNAKSTTFRLSPHAIALIKQLADEHKMSQADVITKAVCFWAMEGEGRTPKAP